MKEMKSEIRFVYFDVGGVVIKDFSKTNKWDELVTALGISAKVRSEFNDLFNEYKSEFFVGTELSVFVEAASQKFGLFFPDGYDMTADIVSRFAANPSLWPIIKDIQSRKRIGLLTNMYPRMLDLIKGSGLFPEIDWEVVIDSSIEGCRKPDAEIYQLAVDRSGVEPVEILLVDNSIPNIEAAKSLGWQTFLYDPADVEASNSNLSLILKEYD